MLCLSHKRFSGRTGMKKPDRAFYLRERIRAVTPSEANGQKNEAMYRIGGTACIYPIYSLYLCFNAVTGEGGLYRPFPANSREKHASASPHSR